jgi:uncharacterized protein YndB with AHSA1/START domain
MKTEFDAVVEMDIHAPATRVWDALVNPAVIKKYMFGADVISDWKKGSSIIWKGEWEGKPFEDRGTVLDVQPNKKLMYSHISPLPNGKEDTHTVTIELTSGNDVTHLNLVQDNNTSSQAKKHSEGNWSMMLGEMKKAIE